MPSLLGQTMTMGLPPAIQPLLSYCLDVFEVAHLDSLRMDDPKPLLRREVSLGGSHKYPNVAAYIAAQPKFDAAISPDDGPAIVSLHRQCESASSVSNLSTQGPADSQVSVLVVSSCNPVTHIA